MSLVNDVLRDLEKRKAPDRSGFDMAASSGIVERHSTVNSGLILLVILLLAIIAGILAYFLLGSEEQQSTPAPYLPGLSLNEPLKSQDVQKPAERQVEAQGSGLKDSVTQLAKTVSDSQAAPVAKAKQKEEKEQQVAKQSPAPRQKETQRLTTDSVPVKQIKPARQKAGKSSDERMAVALENLPPPSAVSPAEIEAPAPMKTAIVSADEKDRLAASQALELIAEGELALGVRSLYEFIEVNEVDIRSRTVLASHLLGQQRLAEAGDVIYGAGDLRDYPDLRALKARWLHSQGRYDQAVSVLMTNLPQVSEYTDYYSLLAVYSQQQGLYEQTFEAYSLLLQVDPGRAEWWAGRAIASENTGRLEDAKSSYTRALQLKTLQPKLMRFVETRLDALGTS